MQTHPHPRKFGDPVPWRLRPEDWKKNRDKRKQDGRKTFETKHKYSSWFFGTSLHNDYGSFTCNMCQRTFYHSPAKIFLAGKLVYNCCCGYCTNNIITRDWGGKLT